MSLPARLLLPDVLLQRFRAQRALDRLLLGRDRCGGDEAVGFDHECGYA